MTSSSAQHKNVSLRVEGMACESCAGRVERAISSTPGVVSASVDLGAGRANVVFAGVPDIAAVIAAIGEAGYECALDKAASA